MTRVPNLPWLHNLFDNAAMAQPMKLQQTRINADAYCACGCLREHKHRVTQTVHSDYGSGWRVLYFASDACKTRFNKARVAQ
jgi:hypothetical protein